MANLKQANLKQANLKQADLYQTQNMIYHITALIKLKMILRKFEWHMMKAEYE
ncbi:MAG: pentapeptide repeat-containing protein [Ruminococcus sp.]|nr:pentapeptide repeat-containing protein [Ruminococcus sp.]